MEKTTRVVISHEDFLSFLAKEGVNVPNKVKIQTHCGQDLRYMFPIVIEWNESKYPEYKLDYRFNTRQEDEIRQAVAEGKIPAIKKVREFSNWGLLEAKHWVEHRFFPSTWMGVGR
jgi:hypothetical protein